MDAVTLAVLRGGLQSITDQMDSVMMRSAISPIIAEAEDRANGIYEPVTGGVVVQGERSLPIFINAMQHTVENVLRSDVSMAPGDIVIVNDPFIGGTHLMDVKLVKPVFVDGELFALLASTGHWIDVGGMVPGGFTAGAEEIYQEGLRLPPVHLMRGGRMNTDLVEVVLANVRTPRECRADLFAQINALNYGERALHGFVDQHGAGQVREAMRELRERSEQLMRSALRRIPDGRYHFVDHIDNDGIVDEPLRIDLVLTADDGALHFDFSDSSPPCRGPLNGVMGSTVSACAVAIKHLFPDVPINAGCFLPLSFTVPDTTFLNAQHPRPVSGCSAEVTMAVIDVVFGAVAQAAPELAPAGGCATAGNFVIGGDDPESGPFVMYLIQGGGYGGHWAGDGLTNGSTTIGVSPRPAAEIYELRYPVVIERYELRHGSGGRGRHRGGSGVVSELRLLRGTAVASGLGNRAKVPAFGLRGGESGAPTRVVFSVAGEEYRPPLGAKFQRVRLEAGDSVVYEMPGGGGFGEPVP